MIFHYSRGGFGIILNALGAGYHSRSIMETSEQVAAAGLLQLQNDSRGSSRLPRSPLLITRRVTLCGNHRSGS